MQPPGRTRRSDGSGAAPPATGSCRSTRQRSRSLAAATQAAPGTDATEARSTPGSSVAVMDIVMPTTSATASGSHHSAEQEVSGSARSVEELLRALEEARAAQDAVNMARHEALACSAGANLRSDVARLDAEIESVRAGTQAAIAGVMNVHEAGRLLACTIDHISQGSLPTSCCTSLLWPGNKMLLYGNSSRRLGVLYDMDECQGLRCYLQDAHTTLTFDRTSHTAPMTAEQLREELQAAAVQQQWMLYNEVTVDRVGPVLGFAVIKPFHDNSQELAAKVTALQLHGAYPGSTIVHFDESSGTCT